MSSPDLGEVFDAAHVEFAVLSPLLWEPLGAATVARSAPRPGERVLDVCCGAGSSAFPAAAAVGPTGLVDAIDLADRLLDQGRARAAANGLRHLRFIHADATTWPGIDGGYDVVQCVFGVFFFPDMDIGSAHLVGLLRPGGRFTAATWDRSAIRPVPQVLIEAIRAEGGAVPDQSAQPDGARPPERVNTPELLADWLGGLGLREVEVTRFPHRLPFTEESAWALVLGSALRGLLAGLDAGAVERVRTRFLGLLTDRGVAEVAATTLIGTGRR
jgi:SAM-dependent methyltransferase